MTYQDAQAQLLAYVRDRVHNGELTERRLAGLIGISQPHVHNVLKGVRNLSPEIFDSILKHFQMSLLDLAPAEDVLASLRRRSPERTADVGVLARAIGPGTPWSGVIGRRRFPLPFVSLAVPAQLVMAKLAADRDMSVTLAGADIALLDTSEQRRRHLVPNGLYVVSRGPEALLRYLRPGAFSYYLATDANLNHPTQWDVLRLTRTELFEAVRARVQWLGRERDRNLPILQRGRFLYEAISR